MTSAFPLDWPAGWPRTAPEARRRHLQGGERFSEWDRVANRIYDELRLLGAADVVLSTNQPLRRDGRPYAARRLIDDPGVAAYFTWKGRQMAMAQDRYREVGDNMRSLALSIHGLRQMNRHGGGHMVERAFRGFAALPAPEDRNDWRTVLGFVPGQTLADVRRTYKRLALACHPDRPGGSDSAMRRLNAALRAAQDELPAYQDE